MDIYSYTVYMYAHLTMVIVTCTTKWLKLIYTVLSVAANLSFVFATVNNDVRCSAPTPTSSELCIPFQLVIKCQ